MGCGTSRRNATETLQVIEGVNNQGGETYGVPVGDHGKLTVPSGPLISPNNREILRNSYNPNIIVPSTPKTDTNSHHPNPPNSARTTLAIQNSNPIAPVDPEKPHINDSKDALNPHNSDSDEESKEDGLGWFRHKKDIPEGIPVYDILPKQPMPAKIRIIRADGQIPKQLQLRDQQFYKEKMDLDEDEYGHVVNEYYSWQRKLGKFDFGSERVGRYSVFRSPDGGLWCAETVGIIDARLRTRQKVLLNGRAIKVFKEPFKIMFLHFTNNIVNGACRLISKDRCTDARYLSGKVCGIQVDYFDDDSVAQTIGNFTDLEYLLNVFSLKCAK